MRRVPLLVLLACLTIEAQAATIEVGVRLPAGAPVEDAAVVLEPLTGRAPTRKQTARIEQVDREFTPYLSIVQKGTSVQFPNRDRIKHHVYSFSPAKTFEIKLYVGQPAKPVVFDKSGEVVLGCNIHDWMEAHVLVVESPWFGKTAANGRVRLDNVPAGRYRVSVWHPRQMAAAAVQTVTLGAAPLRADFALDVAPPHPRFKPPADPDTYR
ncbi:MAG: methylamine utilization protein [Gammaproteobacteria bacterium]